MIDLEKGLKKFGEYLGYFKYNEKSLIDVFYKIRTEQFTNGHCSTTVILKIVTGDLSGYEKLEEVEELYDFIELEQNSGCDSFTKVMLKLGELAFIETTDENISVKSDDDMFLEIEDSEDKASILYIEENFKKIDVINCNQTSNIDEWLQHITNYICKNGNLTSLEFKTENYIENYTDGYREEIRGFCIATYNNNLGCEEAYLIAEIYEVFKGHYCKVVRNGFIKKSFYIFDKSLLKKISDFCNENKITMKNRIFPCYTELKFETDQQVERVYNECLNKIKYLTFKEIKDKYKDQYICVVNIRRKSYEKRKYEYGIEELGGDVYLHSADYELFKQEIKRLGLGVNSDYSSYYDDKDDYVHNKLSEEEYEKYLESREERYAIINNTREIKYDYKRKYVWPIYTHTLEYTKYIRNKLVDKNELFEEVFVENTKMFKIYSDDDQYYNGEYSDEFKKENICDLFSKYPNKFICLGNLNYYYNRKFKPMKFYDSNVTAGTVLMVNDNYNDLVKYVRKNGLVDTSILYAGNINDLDGLGNIINSNIHLNDIKV